MPIDKTEKKSIAGLVARIVNDEDLIINKGSNDGVL